MAGGSTRDGAVQDQIDDTVKDAVEAARARLNAESCNREIEVEARRVAFVVACRDHHPAELLNRRREDFIPSPTLPLEAKVSASPGLASSLHSKR